MWISWRINGGDGCDYDGDGCGDKCGDGHAKETRVAAILPNPLHPINNTPNNQSKPIVQSLFPNLL